ncbi:MAG TPA: lysophospholipid acyltransferase family protein [Candidatus Limnocylindrales bacterium]|nr:lysophospholipid acyltransferase family protein [Candidatus Limnocylindrales bacterium]
MPDASPEETAARLTAQPAVDPAIPGSSRARLFLNRLLFRSMLFTMGSIAVFLHLVVRDERLTWRFAKAQARNLARVLGVHVTVRGLERLPRGPVVFVANHQSHFDIAAILGFIPGYTRFTAKKELFREPVLGLVMRTMGMVPIDREDTGKSVERLRRLRAGDHSLVFFPEGTRSRTGNLKPFKKGAFVTAMELGLPIVPIACRGGRDIMPAGGYLSIVPGNMELIVLDAIPTSGLAYDQRDRLADQARAAIAAALE